MGLRVSVDNVQGGAGNWAIPILFDNTGRTVCRLHGYPGVSWVNSSGGQIGAAAVRPSSPLPEPVVVLAPGQSARAVVLEPTQADQQLFGCTLAQAAGLKVYPPDNTVPVIVSHGGANFSSALQWCANGKSHAVVQPVQSSG